MTMYPPPYEQQPYYGQVVPPASGMAVASLVLGITGLLFSWIPLVGIVAWPLVIAGLVLGLIAMPPINRSERTGYGLALGGMITSGLGLLICCGYLLFFVFALGG
jgi:hypothetical protein